MGTKLDGPLNLEADLNGTLQKPRLFAKVNAPATRIGELDGVVVRVRARYSPDRIDIESARINWKELSKRNT
jgi:autotransporter translocation and assembly factor TamB